MRSGVDLFRIGGRGATEGPKHEIRRAEAGGGVLGRGASSPPPHQLGNLRERRKLPQWGPVVIDFGAF